LAQVRDQLNGVSNSGTIKNPVLSGTPTGSWTGAPLVSPVISGTPAISSAAVTWSGNPTHSGAHTWSGVQTFSSNPAGKVTSGTYTPTITNDANVSSSSSDGTWKWSRVGSVVTVSGAMIVTATAAGSTSTILGISLPVASSMTATEDARGVGASYQQNRVGVVAADVANDRLVFNYLSPTTSAVGFAVTAQYVVI
jgi:hypothetical protein